MEKSWIIICVSTSGRCLFAGYSEFIYPRNSYLHPLCNCYIPLHPTAGLDPIDPSALHPAGLSMSPDLKCLVFAPVLEHDPVV